MKTPEESAAEYWDDDNPNGRLPVHIAARDNEWKAELDAAVDKLTRDAIARRTDFEATCKKNVQLRTEVRDCKADLEAARAELAELKSDDRMTAIEVQELHDEIEKLRETMRATIETTRAEVAAMRARLGTAEGLLDSIRKHPSMTAFEAIDAFLAAPSADSPVAGEAFDPPAITRNKKPTIADIEAILTDKTERRVEIQPDGEVRVVSPDERRKEMLDRTYHPTAESFFPAFTVAPNNDPLAPVWAKLRELEGLVFCSVTHRSFNELAAKVAALEESARLRWGDYDKPLKAAPKAR